MFNDEINSDVPVLVDFWAPWCGPCRMMMPTIEHLSQSHKVIKMNIDEDTGRELGMRYNIEAVPTLLIFKNGKPVKRLVGLQTKEKITQAISEVT